MNQRQLLTGLLILAAIGFTGFFLASMRGHDRTRVTRDRFGAMDAVVSAHVSVYEGWSSQDYPLLAPGTTGTVIYDLPKDFDEELILRVDLNEEPNLIASVFVLSSEGERSHLLNPGTNEFDLTSINRDDFAIIRVGLTATLPAGSTANSVKPFELMEVTAFGPRTVHWGPALFFLFSGLVVWLGVVGALCWAAAGLIPGESITTSGERLTLCILLIIGLGVAVSSPRFLEEKPFDDIRAISNAGVIMDTGADPSRLYFRSRLRPGFLSYALPVVMAFPQRLYHVQTAPSDDYKRIWREYDREGDSFTFKYQSEFTILAMVQAALWLLAIGGLSRRLGLEPIAAAATTVVAAFAYRFMLDNPITITWNLTVNLAAVCSYFMWRERGGWCSALLTGLILALAGLTKTTAITSAIPIGVHLIVSLYPRAREPEFKTELPQSVAMIGVSIVPVVIWFEQWLDGLIPELSGFKDEVYMVMELHPEFPRRTPSLIAQLLWQLGNVLWIPVIVGVVLSIFQKWKGSPPRLLNVFWMTWLLAALLLPLTMPFMYARFFKYSIPAMAWFAGLTVSWMLVRYSSYEKQVETMQ